MSPGSLTLQHMSEYSSFLRINNTPLCVYYHILLTHSSIKGHLNCFPVLAAVNDPAMNMDIQISLQVLLLSYFGYIYRSRIVESSVQFSSVTQSRLTLCDPMDCSTQATLPFTNSQSLLKLISLKLGYHLTISSSVASFSCFQYFPASGSFPISQFFASSDQSFGASASTSVLR